MRLKWVQWIVAILAGLVVVASFEITPAIDISGNETDARALDSLGEPNDLAQATFGDGPWTMRVDREWDRLSGGVQFPSDPLDEADYKPVANGPSYGVTVTWSANSVAVGSPPMSGARNSEHEDRYYYDLTEGVFAGGRFVVWPDDDGALQAELTIYGSGVPIIGSERGELTSADRQSTSYLPACP